MKPVESLENLKGVDSADVYKAGTLAAVLLRARDTVEFRYLPEYLAGPFPPVATTLPKTSESVRSPAGAVPPFFAGLLPEGRRLTSLRRALKASADDELSLLLGVGSDTIGDVQVVPAGEPPQEPEALLQVERDWAEIRFADLLSEAGIVDPVGIPGVQDKASAVMLSVPVAKARGRYILKIDPPEYPHVVRNEAFFLEIARRVGMDCADAEVVRDRDGRSGLLVRRFDRVVDEGGNLMRRACEDACQVLGRWPADKYSVTTEEAVLALADRCAARPVALRRLFEQVVFAWLTGNGDLHAKNLAILATSDGEWRIAPAYDLPSTVLYDDKRLALSIADRKQGISRRHLLDLAGDIGLPRTVGEKRLDDLLTRLTGLDERILDGALPFPRNVARECAAEFRYRQRLARG